jgi:hypothetical protein
MKLKLKLKKQQLKRLNHLKK